MPPSLLLSTHPTGAWGVLGGSKGCPAGRRPAGRQDRSWDAPVAGHPPQQGPAAPHPGQGTPSHPHPAWRGRLSRRGSGPRAAGSANVNIPPEFANSAVPIRGLCSGARGRAGRGANAQGSERWDAREGRRPQVSAETRRARPSSARAPRAGTCGAADARRRRPGRGRPGANFPSESGPRRPRRAAGSAGATAGCAWTPGAGSRPRLPGFRGAPASGEGGAGTRHRQAGHRDAPPGPLRPPDTRALHLARPVGAPTPWVPPPVPSRPGRGAQAPGRSRGQGGGQGAPRGHPSPRGPHRTTCHRRRTR